MIKSIMIIAIEVGEGKGYINSIFIWGGRLKERCQPDTRLISVIDVVGPMNPYQPIPFHILSFVVFKSRVLIYAGSNI